jgi:ABC-type sugar transport system ATPase subunit
MVDRDVTLQGEGERGQSDESVLEVRDLCVRHPERVERLVVDEVSFSLKRGETLGLAGLQGSGTSEVLHALFGALGLRASGTVRFLGEQLSLRSPRESIERGLVLLTSDRKSSGIIPELSVAHNAALASLDRFSNQLGWVDDAKEHAAVRELTDGFRLRAPSLSAPVRTLSGGNQQKVCLARCMLAQPRVLLLDEPTRGIDVAAKADVYELIREWVGQGIAIMLITSEMDELLALSDRILVMHRGRVAAEFRRAMVSKDAVMSAAMGHSK